jgi:sec-independent protein translocase protein TatA
MGLENPLHIAIIVVVILLVFGAKRLPEIGRSLGEGMRGFKDTVTGATTTEPEKKLAPPAAAAPATPAPTPPPAATAGTEAPPPEAG